MKFKPAFLAALAGLALSALPVLAHHSFAAEFDINKPVNLKGKFVQIEWINPHSWIHIDVIGPDGQPVSWTCEALPPNALYRQGWRKDSLKPGDEIILEGYQAKDGTNTAWTRAVTTPDGRRMFAGSPDSLPPSSNKTQ